MDPNQARPPPPRRPSSSPPSAASAFLSFGGPAAQIAVMHDEIVERRRWLTEREFLDALGFLH